MITYELAKELKEAGFPHDWGTFGDTEIHSEEDMNKQFEIFKEGICPTLSELIEACGNHFWNLNKSNLHWFASSQKYTRTFHIEKGNTPEEATARLWLSLKKDGPSNPS